MFGRKNKITEEQVLATLSKVMDPDLHRDIVTLGMISDIKINGGKVSKLELNPLMVGVGIGYRF